MKSFFDKSYFSYLVILGGSVLLLISFGIRHTSGLYLVPISDHLQTGREIFGLAVAIQFLLIGIGSRASKRTGYIAIKRSTTLSHPASVSSLQAE